MASRRKSAVHITCAPLVQRDEARSVSGTSLARMPRDWGRLECDAADYGQDDKDNAGRDGELEQRLLNATARAIDRAGVATKGAAER